MARLVLPGKGSGLARTGLLGFISPAPVITYIPFPYSCLCNECENLESISPLLLVTDVIFFFRLYFPVILQL